jgi:acyl-coenzyme A synthetase/AMP-(fatty) acid ligase
LDVLQCRSVSDGRPVTFLSILAHDAIALPLSQEFPANELRYIIENSEAKIFLSTTKFQDKANEVLAEGLDHKPILKVSEKVEAGAESDKEIKLEAMTEGKGGFMLYTSGTTNRPVRKLLWNVNRSLLIQSTERSCSQHVSSHSSGRVTHQGMAIYAI